MTYHLSIAHPTGRVTKSGLTEKAWRAVAAFSADDLDEARRHVREAAKQSGAARATADGLEFTCMREYEAEKRT